MRSIISYICDLLIFSIRDDIYLPILFSTLTKTFSTNIKYFFLLFNSDNVTPSRLLFFTTVFKAAAINMFLMDFLKVFDSALYYTYEIKHNEWQSYQASLHWMLLRDLMSHRRGGQLCEWYKISKKLIKSSNLNGSLILKYQWIQKGITHHYIWPRSQNKKIFILKNKENTLRRCDCRTNR